MGKPALHRMMQHFYINNNGMERDMRKYMHSKIAMVLIAFVFVPGISANAEPVTHKGATYSLTDTYLPDCSLYIDPEDAEKFSHCAEVEEIHDQKWYGYLEFLGKPGTARSIGQSDLFLPLMQDENDMTFFNMRGMADFANDSEEFNIGGGHRHKFDKFILGGYGYYDRLYLDGAKAITQTTLGAEILSEDFDIRANGYIPTGKTVVVEASRAVSTAEENGTIKVNVRSPVYRKALHGYDGEIGYKLPMHLVMPKAVNDLKLFEDTRLFVGGYHFIAQGEYGAIMGPRIRLETSLYDLPVLGNGSRLMFGMETQYDDPRGVQNFGMLALRIPFGGGELRKTTRLKGLDRRMMQPIVRDVDIGSNESPAEMQETEILHPDGSNYSEVVSYDACTGNTGDLMALMDVKVAQGGNPLAIVTDTCGKGMSVDGQIISGGWTWAQAGRTMNAMYADPFTGERSTVQYTPAGAAPVITGYANTSLPFLEMADGAHISGWNIDTRGRWKGLNLDDPGTYFVTDTTLLTDSESPSDLAGAIKINHDDATLYLKNSRIKSFFNESKDLYSASAMFLRKGTLVAEDLTVEGQYAGGAFLMHSGTATLTRSTISMTPITDFHRYADEERTPVYCREGTNSSCDVQVSGQLLGGQWLWQNGIYMWNPKGNASLSLNDVVVEGFGGNGLYMSSSYAGKYTAHVQINNSVFRNGTHHANSLGDLRAEETDYAPGTTGQLSQSEGFALQVFSGTVDIANSSIYNNANGGIKIGGSANKFPVVNARNITVTGNGGHGVKAANDGVLNLFGNNNISGNGVHPLLGEDDYGEGGSLLHPGIISLDGQPCTSETEIPGSIVNCMD